jgi:hypothetical protein
MKHSTIILISIYLNFFSAYSFSTAPINAILGDESYIKKFNSFPVSSVDEKVRIKTHLEFVENQLRVQSTKHLSKNQTKNRNKVLNLLHAYWKAGKFPSNYDYPSERKPCFIDKTGNICAVGFLIEMTDGRAVSEKINHKYQYEYLLNMNEDFIDSWIHEYGLTKLECAMIQPTYGIAPTENYIAPGFGYATAVFSGVNVALSAINAQQIKQTQKSIVAPILGMALGAGQITLGAFNYPEVQYGWNTTYFNEAQRNYALMNVALGTSTLVFSTWNLVTRKQPKPSSLTWNVGAFPSGKDQFNLAFSFRKTL